MCRLRIRCADFLEVTELNVRLTRRPAEKSDSRFRSTAGMLPRF
ncbi:hypothetical protein GZL_07739 [Streptomyces sp. 769]|nr:hypothetical protein GZL_07739 [Streptomyces sp. 769]